MFFVQLDLCVLLRTTANVEVATRILVRVYMATLKVIDKLHELPVVSSTLRVHETLSSANFERNASSH